jgi:malonate decarboxylase alpha subunit
MTVQTSGPALSSWTTRRDEKQRGMQLVQPWMKGPVLSSAKVVEALETLIVSGDRIVLEGDNQKQADFLSRSLGKGRSEKASRFAPDHSSISRPEHLTLFELGIAKKADFSFADPQSLRVSQLLEDGKLEIGAMPQWISTCSI